tara:strand:+ start:5351 stop:5545 length:195 start_codon:yes stop_codon:yes gene_type:complete
MVLHQERLKFESGNLGWTPKVLVRLVGEDAVSEETMKCPAGGYFSLPAPIGVCLRRKNEDKKIY